VKVAIVSDSPTLTTGFGVTTDRIARALTRAGHVVACFGLKAFGETFHRADYPFRIWTVAIDPGAPWSELLRRFLDHERPDVLFINMDIFNLREVLGYCSQSAWSGPLVVYLVLDGVPAYDRYTALIPQFDQILVTTEAGRAYLRRCGAIRLHLAPPGVSRSVFRPLEEADTLRVRAGLTGRFVVGCFGRNCERKQQPRILDAVARLDRAGRAEGIVVYFHCKRRGYWHLDEIAEEAGLAHRVLYADDGDYDETAGVPYAASRERASSGDGAPSQPPGEPAIPSDFGYVERMNWCDLIVNPAHCGDFENVLIEAQACGVPLAATDDGGIMAEAMGAGGILLPPADVGRWKVGQRIFLVDVGALAEAIVGVKDDPDRRSGLRERGMENAARYPWSRLEEAAIEAVEAAHRG